MPRSEPTLSPLPVISEHDTIADLYLRMLYEFHRWQNSTSPGKVHATYLIYGTRKPETEVQADGDVDMMSSAPESESWDHHVSTQTLTLVAEDRLKGTAFSVSLEQNPSSTLSLSADMSQMFLRRTRKSLHSKFTA